VVDCNWLGPDPKQDCLKGKFFGVEGKIIMNYIETKMKWLMVVAGALTCTMVYAAIAPRAALQSTFGETLDGPLAELIVRNWAILITLVGAMLIYGAFNPAVRPLALAVALVSKLAFVALVLANGERYLGNQAGIAIAIDFLWVVLFAWYLIRTSHRPKNTNT
jgi:hypothetical protein